MDPTWTAPMWFVLMTLLLGIGSGFATWFTLTIYLPRMQARSFNEWAEQGRTLAIAVIDTDAAAAGAKRDLFEWIGKLPDDFNPTLFLATDLGMGLHRAVLNEAERRGLVRAGTFERVYGARLDVASPTELLDAPPPTFSWQPPPPSTPPPGSTVHRARLPTDVHEIGAWLDDAVA
jgi:hypothetical protein